MWASYAKQALHTLGYTRVFYTLHPRNLTKKRGELPSQLAIRDQGDEQMVNWLQADAQAVRLSAGES